MKHPSQNRKAFTLVELLVVIGIIALLISILLPSLSKARSSAMNIKCANNLRSMGQIFFVYANSNRSYFPCGIGPTAATPGAWLWDIPIPTRDLYVDTGAQRRQCYCPVFADMDVDALWTYPPTGTATISVWGYIVLVDRGGNRSPAIPQYTFPQPLVNLSYQTRTAPLQKFYDTTLSPPGWVSPLPSPETVLAADGTPSSSSSTTAVSNTFHVAGGWNAQEHVAAHPNGKRGFPEGGNVLYMDGHVVWIPFDSMKLRTTTNPYWWF